MRLRIYFIIVKHIQRGHLNKLDLLSLQSIYPTYLNFTLKTCILKLCLEPQVQVLRNETYFIIILENIINLYCF